MAHRANAQYTMVLNHLKEYGEITPAEAYSLYGVLRLGALIFMYRADGYDIDTTIMHHKNRFGNITNYAKYTLKED